MAAVHSGDFFFPWAAFFTGKNKSPNWNKSTKVKFPILYAFLSCVQYMLDLGHKHHGGFPTEI